jgi:hypothetical protein
MGLGRRRPQSTSRKFERGQIGRHVRDGGILEDKFGEDGTLNDELIGAAA